MSFQKGNDGFKGKGEGDFKEIAPKRFNLIFPPDEMTLLTELAKTTNRSKNATLRMLIRYGHLYFVQGQEMPVRNKEVA